MLAFGFENVALAESPDSVVTKARSEVHLAIGPAMAGIQRAEGWDTQVGGELHLVRLASETPLAALGGAFGALTFAEDETIRLYLDTYVGFRITSDLTIGVALAPVVDLHPTRRSQLGFRGTAWVHAGIAPYVAASKTWGLGASDHIDIAVGLRIPFSIARF